MANQRPMRNLVLACAVSAVLLLAAGSGSLAAAAAMDCPKCDDPSGVVLGLAFGWGFLILAFVASLGCLSAIVQYGRALQGKAPRGHNVEA